MAKYNEIMSRVSVTSEMRERVLGNVIAHQSEGENDAVNRKSGIKHLIQWIPIAAAACFLLVIGIQFNHVNQLGRESVGEALESVVEYASLADLEKGMGFDVPEIDPIPFEVTETGYTNCFGVARVDYYGENGESITLSKAKDTGTDISGDYNEYSSVTEKEIEGAAITLKGNDGTISLAVWNQDGYSYALYADPGASPENMTDMLLSVLK